MKYQVVKHRLGNEEIEAIYDTQSEALEHIQQAKQDEIELMGAIISFFDVVEVNE